MFYFLTKVSPMKRFAQIILSIACCTSGLCNAEEPSLPAQEQTTPHSFFTMSDDEQKACGLDKLSSDERSSLQAWITKFSSVSCCPCSTQQQVSTPIKIQSFKEGAKIITLADGRIFTLSNTAKKTASSWKVDDLVTVEAGKRKNSFILYHIISGKSVKAKIDNGEKNIDCSRSK